MIIILIGHPSTNLRRYMLVSNVVRTFAEPSGRTQSFLSAASFELTSAPQVSHKSIMPEIQSRDTATDAFGTNVTNSMSVRNNMSVIVHPTFVNRRHDAASRG
eukprot:9483726-Pyramimonas_sp.AAC.2